MKRQGPKAQLQQEIRDAVSFLYNSVDVSNSGFIDPFLHEADVWAELFPAQPGLPCCGTRRRLDETSSQFLQFVGQGLHEIARQQYLGSREPLRSHFAMRSGLEGDPRLRSVPPASVLAAIEQGSGPSCTDTNLHASSHLRVHLASAIRCVAANAARSGSCTRAILPAEWAVGLGLWREGPSRPETPGASEVLVVPRDVFIEASIDVLRRWRASPPVMKFWEIKIYGARKRRGPRFRKCDDEVKPIKEVRRAFDLERFEGYQKRYVEMQQGRLAENARRLLNKEVDEGRNFQGRQIPEAVRRAISRLREDVGGEIGEGTVEGLLTRICDMLVIQPRSKAKDDNNGSARALTDDELERLPVETLPWVTLLSLNGVGVIFDHSGLPLLDFLGDDKSNFQLNEEQVSSNENVSLESRLRIIERELQQKQSTEISKMIKWKHLRWMTTGEEPTHRNPKICWISEQTNREIERQARAERKRRQGPKNAWQESLRGGLRTQTWELGTLDTKEVALRQAELPPVCGKKHAVKPIWDTDGAYENSLAKRIEKVNREERANRNIRRPGGVTQRGYEIHYEPYLETELAKAIEEALKIAEGKWIPLCKQFGESLSSLIADGRLVRRVVKVTPLDILRELEEAVKNRPEISSLFN